MSERFTDQDKLFLRKTIELATRGVGFVSPNPMVGAVVVSDGEIVGTGYHRRFGGDHAEVEAIREAGHRARGATLYCNLEPCSHYGKTPPCVDRIIEAGLGRVLIGGIDPNPRVNGSGVKRLREQGVEVESGLLAEACLELNESYFKFITSGVPFIHLKVAQTLDGNIADKNGHSNWISNERSRRLVHTWRWQHDAVLVGIGTVLSDNPRLTVRVSKGLQPRRVVLDSHLRIPLESHLLSDEFTERTIVITSTACQEEKKAQAILERGAKLWRLDVSPNGSINSRQALEQLGRENIAALLVEGGRKVFSSLVEEKLADRLTIFIAPLLLGDAIPAFQGLPIHGISQSITLPKVRWRIIGDNAMVTGRIDYPRLA